MTHHITAWRVDPHVWLIRSDGIRHEDEAVAHAESMEGVGSAAENGPIDCGIEVTGAGQNRWHS